MYKRRNKSLFEELVDIDVNIDTDSADGFDDEEEVDVESDESLEESYRPRRRGRGLSLFEELVDIDVNIGDVDSDEDDEEALEESWGYSNQRHLRSRSLFEELVNIEVNVGNDAMDDDDEDPVSYNSPDEEGEEPLEDDEEDVEEVEEPQSDMPDDSEPEEGDEEEEGEEDEEEELEESGYFMELDECGEDELMEGNQWIAEAYLRDMGYQLTEDEIFELVRRDVLNERVISAKQEKKMRRSLRAKKTLIVMAKEKNDPLYAKLQKVYARKRAILDALDNKYGTKAITRVRQNERKAEKALKETKAKAKKKK